MTHFAAESVFERCLKDAFFITLDIPSSMLRSGATWWHESSVKTKNFKAGI
jgi:hypothetical protein